MLTDSQFFTLIDRTQLHVKISSVKSKRSSAGNRWLVITHGVGEHLERYQYMVDIFGNDFNILLYDLRGHGKSSGRRTYVSKFSTYVNDLEEIIGMLKADYGMKRFVLFGHSAGATITSSYVQSRRNSECYPEKIFLSSPAIGVPGHLGIALEYVPGGLLSGLSSIPFSAEIGGLISIDNLSHDARVAEEYRLDPFNCLQVQSKFFLELVIAMKSIFSQPLRLKSPCYCAYGTEDKIVCPIAIKNYFQMLEHSVVLQAIEGGYHELHNEIDQYRLPYLEFLQESIQDNFLEI